MQFAAGDQHMMLCTGFAPGVIARFTFGKIMTGNFPTFNMLCTHGQLQRKAGTRVEMFKRVTHALPI
jgi:hypothetical protein